MSGGEHSADALTPVRAALAEGDWAGALTVLRETEPAARASAEGLELLAAAAYGSGDVETTLAAWEDLYGLCRSEGDDQQAARAAVMLAMFLMMDTGLMAPVRGWVRRAEQLLADEEEVPVHAWVAMVHTYERLMCGDMIAAGDYAQRAIELGTRFGESPPVAIGRVASARVQVFLGDLDEGLQMLDDVAVMLSAGELDPLTTGMVWCELICAMQGLAQYDRAEEWTEAMERWRHGAAFGGINGRCRVHRAEILRVRGPFDEAEDQALLACEELRPWMRREFGWPLNELGNVRLRRGDLAGAEEAFLAAHEHAWSPEPGLAQLRLAQGDIASAATLIHTALEHPFDIPSKERPPFGGLRRAPLLDAQVEIAIAAGDVTTARAAAEELDEIATRYRSRALSACAVHARGRIAIAEGDVDRSLRELARAVAAWTDLGAPYEAGIARLELGRAHEAAGHHDVACMEWRAALSTFERIGARRGVALAVEVLDDSPAPNGPPDTMTESRSGAACQVFRCEGDTRTITFDGVTVLLRDLKGLRYLERLLAEPGREFHALDLVAVERGSLPTGPHTGDDRASAAGPGDAGAVFDEQARESYRRRLAEIEEDIDEATHMNDPERVSLAEADRDYLIRELARGVGLGGRNRYMGATSERARTSVTRALRYALARIAEHHRALAKHLEHTVRTGTYCSYDPDPRLHSRWET